MKFQLVSKEHAGLQSLAISSNMENFARIKLGRLPEIGEQFSLTMSGPNQKSGLAATQDDYEKSGTWEATGIFCRVE